MRWRCWTAGSSANCFSFFLYVRSASSPSGFARRPQMEAPANSFPFLGEREAWPLLVRWRAFLQIGWIGAGHMTNLEPVPEPGAVRCGWLRLGFNHSLASEGGITRKVWANQNPSLDQAKASSIPSLQPSCEGRDCQEGAPESRRPPAHLPRPGIQGCNPSRNISACTCEAPADRIPCPLSTIPNSKKLWPPKNISLGDNFGPASHGGRSTNMSYLHPLFISFWCEFSHVFCCKYINMSDGGELPQSPGSVM